MTASAISTITTKELVDELENRKRIFFDSFVNMLLDNKSMPKQLSREEMQSLVNALTSLNNSFDDLTHGIIEVLKYYYEHRTDME